MIFKRDSGVFEYLIVGLGNPGQRYEYTRHNTGFLCVDLFAAENGFKIDRLKFHALTADRRIDGKRCLFMKPVTFMNLSGEAVGEAAKFYKIPPENIIVIFDDVCLPVGRMRIRRKGSAGGHNGIKSIIEHLGSDNFPRIKIGVGEKPNEEYDLADWVLTPYKKEELKLLRQVSLEAGDALRQIIAGDIDRAMSDHNS